MAMILFWDFTSDGDYWDYTTSCLPEPSRIKKKNANIFIRIKWFVLISVWKFNNRKWKKCRHKTKALEKYKDSLTKGYWV